MLHFLSLCIKGVLASHASPNFFFKIYLFIYWLRWVFVAVRGLSLVVASGGYSVAVRGLLIAVASLIVEHGL